MSLTTVYAALNASLTGNAPNFKIDLYAASALPALASLRGVLSLFGIVGSYELSQAHLRLDVGGVVLTGIGKFCVPGADFGFQTDVTARVMATSASSADEFELALSIDNPGWTFGRTFPVLPPSQQLEGQFASYTTSFLTLMRMDAPTFTARSVPGAMVRLTGLLPLPQAPPALLQHVDLLAPWPLRVDGTVAMPMNSTEPPELDLIAVSTGLRLELGPLSVNDVGLQIQAFRGLDEEEAGLTAYSILKLAGTFSIGSGPGIRGRISTPILLVGESWHFLAQFESDANSELSKGIEPIDDLVGVSLGQFLPPGFLDLVGFYVSDIELVVGPIDAGGVAPEFKQIGVTLASKKTWNPPIPFVSLTNVATRWVVGWTPIAGKQEHYITGSIGGTLLIGAANAGTEGPASSPDLETGVSAEPTSVAIDVTAMTPRFVITGKLQDDSWIPLGAGFRAFFGDGGPSTSQSLAITDLSVMADLRSQTYNAEGTIALAPLGLELDPAQAPAAIWTIRLGTNVYLHLTSLLFKIEAVQGTVTGGITGQIVLEGGAPAGDPDPYIVISAAYCGSDSLDGWIFSGQLYPDSFLELTSLVSNFLGIPPPTDLPTLLIERLSLTFATRSEAYSLSGTMASRWSPQLFGSQLHFSAVASVDVAKAGSDVPVRGRLEGRFAIEKIAVGVAIDIGVEKPTYLFSVEFGGAKLSAVTGWHGENPPHQVLSLQLTGVTLGEILEYLVDLAAPTLGFKLDPPWDVLNRIELSRFVLTIDPIDRSIDLVYTVDSELVLMYIDQIGVRYSRRDGEAAVELILTGRLLNRTYTFGKPLSWNVVKDPPPAIPGDGNELVDLRYLGLGQRITPNSELPNTVSETITLLRSAMRQPDQDSTNPLDQPTGAAMRFAPESEWLIGLEVGLLDAVDLALVFNDPRLYGLAVALSGEKVGSAAGLRFEILYKKISDTVGMFRVELRLPEAFRHIELGEVSITLGVVAVEVYTNGNFLVDLGFPYDRDYDRSFTVQVFPFIGRGGIYFGLLDGTTSRRVPAITNGNFSPVMELGIGLAVGVGKDISVGPLSGGVYVELEVIFQGVLSWFNPASNGTAPAKYYWGQGIVAIHGRLYAQADFAVIKVSLTIDAYAQASAVFEAYQPTLFRLSVGVSIEASVEILFIEVQFTFEVDLDISFTVGRASPTPWVLASGQGTTTQRRLRRNVLPALMRDPARRTMHLRAEHLADLRRTGRLSPALPASRLTGVDGPYLLNWNPKLAVFSTSPRNIPLTMLPAFSLTQVPVSWTGAKPDNPNPNYQVAFLLFAPNGITPGSASAQQTLARSASSSAHANEIGELSADLLIEAFLRWAISAVTGSAGGAGSKITAGQLALLAEQIDRSETASDGFSWSNLATFFATNLTLQIAGDPGGSPAAQCGMAIPIPPALTWTSPQANGVDLAQYNLVGPLYEWGVDQYRAQFFPLTPQVSPAPADDPKQYESFATYLFCDWCLMVAKAAAKAARDTMSAWTYSATTNVSLATVAASFPNVTIPYALRNGDTVDSVAAVLGGTAAELLDLNPGLETVLQGARAGATISVKLGVSTEAVALANADVSLAPSVLLPLGAIDYQATASDTLQSIATSFGFNLAADLLAGTDLADHPRLLRPGSSFSTPAATYTPPSGFTPVLTAAAFYVRCFGRIDIPSADWYAQTVFDFNATALRGVGHDKPIPAGTSLSVPASNGDPDPKNAINYVTLPGDTLMRIGATLSLAQNFASGSGPDADWPQFRNSVQQGAEGEITLPSIKIVILPGETVRLLASRTIIQTNNLKGLIGWLANAAVLDPLAVVTIADAKVTTGTSDTLSSVATAYGLSVSDLGRRIEAMGIFSGSPTAPLTLTIRHLPVQDIDALVARVMTGAAPPSISGLSSRLLLSGLQLPGPVVDQDTKQITANGPLTALYGLTGQQFTGPAPNLNQPNDTALNVTFTADSGFGWIELQDSTTVGSSETLDALLARVPHAHELNGALTRPGRVAPGLVVHTGAVASLKFSYTNADLDKRYPASGLGLSPVGGPAPLAMAGQTPRTYGLDQRVELQAPEALPIPKAGITPLTGNPSLWPLPDALLSRARRSDKTPFEIVRAGNRVDMSDQSDTLLNATFATHFSFSLRRLDPTDHVYELRGVSPGDRQILLALRAYLLNPDTPSATAYLMIAPAPDSGNTSGLRVLANDLNQTFLVKSNLSTETVPPAARLSTDQSADDPAPFGAKLSDLSAFLLLLWEGSVVGGSGYYLRFSTRLGEDIPSGAFEQNGDVTLTLLAIVGEQQVPAPSGRQLFAFNTCALVGAGLDASAHALFVEATDNSELVTQALAPPGTIGFTLGLPKPIQTQTRSADVQLKQLFSLLTYQLSPATGSSFQSSRIGLPAGPQADDGLQLASWERQRLARWKRAGRASLDPPSPGQYWRYDQAIPIARFGPPSAAPAVKGLPDPDLDPYRGIGGQKARQSVQIQLGFADILGNVTAPPSNSSDPTPGMLQLICGYTDPLTAPGSWPAVTTSYMVTKTTDGVTLSITLAAQAGVLMPGPDQDPSAALDAAARQSERSVTSYYQLIQPDVTASVLTTLYQAVDGSPQAMPIGVAPLWCFASAGYLAARASASLVPVRPAALSPLTLQQIAASYGTTFAALAQTNANTRIFDLFGPAALTIPAFRVFAAGDTPDALVASLPSGWPTPTGVALLELSDNATVLPLRSGVMLTIPSRKITVAPTIPTASLEYVAQTHHTSPAMLASDNAFAGNVLADGFVFEIDGVTVEIGEKTLDGNSIKTFTDVATAFEALGINRTLGEIAFANAQRPGLFVSGAILVTNHYVAASDDTLASNQSGASISELAANNHNVADLFDAGALISLGAFPQSAVVNSDSRETLLEFADRFGCPPEQLLGANPTLSIRPASELVLPGTLAIAGDTTGLFVPYTVLAGDTIDEIAKKFDLPEDAEPTDVNLAHANLRMPGTIAGDQNLSVTVEGKTYQTSTQAGDSFQTVLLRLQTQSAIIQLADVVEAIEGKSGYLAAGALLVCPLARLPASDQDPNCVSPDAIPALYGVSAVSFAQTNAALLGLIAKGISISAADGSISVTTGEHDTLNSILSRFASLGIQIGIKDVIRANYDTAFFNVGARALLPPATITLAANLGQEVGPFSHPAFPLSVSLRVARNKALVSPEFATPDHDGPAERADSMVPAPLQPEGSGTEEALTLDAFSASLRMALPSLRLATGRVKGIAADLWVVDFGEKGVSSVTVEPGVPAPNEQKKWPRFMALRPLYNYLVTRDSIAVRKLNSDGTLASTATPTSYQAIDIEPWARRFLTDVDLFLTAPYVTRTYQRDGSRAALMQILTAKMMLSEAIPRGLDAVLTLKDPSLESGRNDAVRRLAQELKSTLSRAYDTTAVIQYDVAVSSPWSVPGSKLPPARLFGTANPFVARTGQGESSTPPYDLTTAKVSLDAPQSFVTFLMRIADPSRHRNVPIDLTYDILDLEMNIRQTQGASDYEDSDWLSFAPPIASQIIPSGVQTSLGAATVPVPLRAFPVLPALLGQSYRASSEIVASLGQTMQWTYGLTYSHEHAEQDELLVTTTYNVPPGVLNHAACAKDVATELAKYIAVADELWAILSGFTASGESNKAVLDAASKTFAELITSVADAWDSHWTAAIVPDPTKNKTGVEEDVPTPQLTAFKFRVRLTSYEGEDGSYYLDDLILVSEQSKPGPSGDWPDAYCRAADGSRIQLGQGKADGQVQTYHFPSLSPIPAAILPQITLEWSGLDLCTFQNARASTSVRRNPKLLGDDGPETNEGFVYRTPTIEAAEIITPLNTWPERIDITRLGTSVELALATAFKALFGAATNEIVTIGVSYGYEIVPQTDQSEGLVSYLPVGLFSSQTVSSGTSATIANMLAEWARAKKPATRGGEWIFSLTVYSQIEKSCRRPLLSIDRLVYRPTEAG
ncbi:hypothetical protein [Bradyrhizobium sp. HKCCYLS20291]|uniref:hypothetical protein n=1 Tax=Bradyrhizobium sp. HKCCYLS20291 TaxID=3420766 RepID=UPI003EB9E1FA